MRRDALDEEILYKLVKLMADNPDDWELRMKNNGGVEFLSSINPDITKSGLHPGALRFY